MWINYVRGSHSGGREVCIVQSKVEQVRLDQRSWPDDGLQLREDAAEDVHQHGEQHAGRVRLHEEPVRRQLLLRAAGQDGAPPVRPDFVWRPSDTADGRFLFDEPEEFLLWFSAGNDQDGSPGHQRRQSRGDQAKLQKIQLKPCCL